MRIVTIGGYGFTEEGFFAALQKAGIDTFVDVRQRRGMRGSKYAFLNSRRLQSTLVRMGIKYIHAIDLAPTVNVRSAQKDEDRAAGIAKRDRTHLSLEFERNYRSKILAEFNIEEFRHTLNSANAIALFCVEGPPSACHRSLAAEYLAQAFGSPKNVEHLRP